MPIMRNRITVGDMADIVAPEPGPEQMTEDSVRNLQGLAALAVRLGRDDLAKKYMDLANRALLLGEAIEDATEDVLNYG